MESITLKNVSGADVTLTEKAVKSLWLRATVEDACDKAKSPLVFQSSDTPERFEGKV